MNEGAIEKQSVPLFVGEGPDAPRPELPFVERNTVTAVVHNPKTGKYLGLRWKKVDWDTFVTGGIEPGQTAEEAARAEILEETGYKNLRLIRELPRFDAKFYHAPKAENRYAHFRCFLFELVDEGVEELSDEERAKHEAVWLDDEELRQFRLPGGHRYLVGKL
jgi:8-oxo-dGTP pyrophosphatase MutT (NUDIX family)